MKFLENRKLRQEISRAFSTKCLNDKFDNSDIIKKTVKLKHERAILLGYNNYADYTLEERMAASSPSVYDLLDRLYDKAYPVAENEIAELKSFALAEDGIKNLQTWDYTYYSEKMKKMLFDFDAEELRPYFKSENVINGVFEVANKLYGITFDKTDEIPVWHKDVKTYKAIDEKGEYLGLLYVDLYPRSTKKGGAWMDEIRSYGLVGSKIKKPHICFICNLTKSTKTQPSLLSFSEVTTIFHEFGHCLHGLLSKVKYKTIDVPGVFEIPVVIAKNINKYDGFITLGCVIKGETPHFDFISKTTFSAIMKLSVDHKKPIGNGIITALDIGQAGSRSGADDLDKNISKTSIKGRLIKANKGREAARAVLSVLGILKNESK